MAVMYWLAQTEADRDALDKAATEGAYNLTLIILIGVSAVLFLIFLAVMRRWGSRQIKEIEAGKEERRSTRSPGRVDAWSAGSDRYVDHDKLPDEVPYDTEPDADEVDEDDDERPGTGMMSDEDEPPFGEGPEERDPYGLFRDKPYQDSDELDDDDDFDDEDVDDEFDEDEDDPRR